MNYSNNPSMVRVDFFKESGKWHDTREMEWLHWGKDELIHDVFLESLKQAFSGSYTGMTAVCLEPYHELDHPLMIHKWDHKPTGT